MLNKIKKNIKVVKRGILLLIVVILIGLFIFIINRFSIDRPIRSVKRDNPHAIYLTTRSYSLIKSSYYYTDLELDPKELALIIIHPWNIGSPNGPPYPEEFALFMGSRENTELANKIMREKIAPVIEWARNKNIKVIYVMPNRVVENFYSQSRLPQPYLEIPDNPTVNIPFHSMPGTFPDNYGDIRDNTTHGAGYNTWDGWKDLAISSYISPQDGDIIVSGDYDGPRIDKWLRDNDINTLLYAGFATNRCVTVDPIGMHDMFRRHYRLILLRNCTMAMEYPETFKSQKVTDLAIRYLEIYLGSSTVISVPD